jgi:hypothetical protein
MRGLKFTTVITGPDDKDLEVTLDEDELDELIYAARMWHAAKMHSRPAHEVERAENDLEMALANCHLVMVPIEVPED